MSDPTVPLPAPAPTPSPVLAPASSPVAAPASSPAADFMAAVGRLKVVAYRNGLTDAVLDEELRYSAQEEREGGIR